MTAFERSFSPLEHVTQRYGRVIVLDNVTTPPALALAKEQAERL